MASKSTRENYVGRYDSFRFAAGIASSIGIRSTVWRPGSLAAPVVGRWLLATVGVDVVLLLDGVAALSGASTEELFERLDD